MHYLVAEVFGNKHLIGLLIVIILFTSIYHIAFKNKSIKTRKMLIIFLIIFYVLEIIKLTYITIGEGSFPIYQLPLHLCSLPLYLYPLLVFFKNSRFIESFIKPTAYSLIMIAGIMALALPTNILGGADKWLPLGDNILPIISFAFHGLMVFSSLMLIKSKYYVYNKTDYARTMIIGILYATIAMIFNLILDKDFMLLNKATGSPLGFIMDISKVLYILSMVGSFAILTGFVFIITKSLVIKNSEYKTKENYI